MTHGSLFSGIGGFELAARIVGWGNAFSCEIDPFCNRVLKYHFPDETQYNDIRRTDFSVWRGRIDVLSGGFPCQPFSQAGKRKGTDDNRYLWPAMLGAIRQIHPRWIVGENVLGIVNWNAGMVFEQVCADLEAEGYGVQPFVLPACGVGAPHRRYRTFFIAYRADAGTQSVQERKDSICSFEYAADTNSAGFQMQGAEQPAAGITGICADTIANPYCERRNGRSSNNDDRTENNPSERTDLLCRTEGYGLKRTSPNTVGHRDQPHGADQEPEGERRPDDGQPQERREPSERVDGLSSFSQSVADSGSEQSQCRDGQRADGRCEPSLGTQQYDGAGFWDGFPTQPPVCRGDDGISEWLDPAAIFEGVARNSRAKPFNRWRNESVKAYGNAVVPPLIVQIFRAIDLFEKMHE